MEKIPYSSYILNNTDYNKVHNESINMNKIKAILHNKVLLSMVNKNLPYEKIVVDQFTPPAKYYEYLSDVKDKVINIIFTPKAEEQCLSVACASIISRYIFLKTMHDISTELGIDIPKGAGTLVDEVASKLVQEKGFDILTKYAKLNFKNTEKVKSMKN